MKEHSSSDTLRGIIDAGKMGLVGAIYNLATGVVIFDDEHLIFDTKHTFSHIPQLIENPL